MAETTGKQLRVVVVTPERAVLDEPASFAVLPLYDGEIGVLPGRAAFVGQLGPGELRVTTGGQVRRFFVDGGFAQVRADVVNVLTPAAKKLDELTPAAVDAERARADALPDTNPAERATKARAKAKAAGMARVAAKRTAG